MAASLLMFQFFNEVLNNDFQIYNELGGEPSDFRGGRVFYAVFLANAGISFSGRTFA